MKVTGEAIDMSFRKQYRKECPETIGETDREFDNANYIEWLEKELEATSISRSVKRMLASAIANLSKDMHCVSQRPCLTCRKMSKAIKKPFGCYEYHKRQGIQTEKFGS